MAFPTMHHGLVCEEVRAEQRGLLSILGFYGVMPAVEIVAQGLPGPFRIGLVLIGGPGDGIHSVIVQIAGPDGKQIVSTGPHPVTVEPTKTRLNLAFGLMGLTIPQPGTYTVRLLVVGSGEPAFESTFSVRLAHPGEIPPAQLGIIGAHRLVVQRQVLHPNTRACVAAAVVAVTSEQRVSSVYDYSRSRYVTIGGSADGDSVSMYDYDRGCHFSGTLPSLYDYGRSVHVSLKLDGTRFSGFDYGDSQHFSGTVSGRSVSIFDYGESAYFQYSV